VKVLEMLESEPEFLKKNCTCALERRERHPEEVEEEEDVY
jgi:hypothetical protein